MFSAALKGARRTSSSSSGQTKLFPPTTPLAKDIRTALSKAITTEGRPAAEGLPAITLDELPKIFTGTYGLGSRDFRPEHVIGAYEFATGEPRTARRQDRGRRRHLHGPRHRPSLLSVVGDETPSLLPDGAVAVRLHSIGGWGAITTGKNLGAIIGDLNDLLYERDGLKDDLGNPKEVIHVSANPKYGSEKKGAPTSYFMVAAKERIRVNCDLRHVTTVLCCDPKAFTHLNPLDGIQPGGSLVWESEEEGEQAWERLPQWARKQIIDKNIRVFTLPGFAIAKKATDRGDLQLRMQGNAFLGAFFAVSSLLNEFGITPEQYREVVYKQYVKKFGKLGDAVVQSNMEVMTQGFEQVKEIKIGELVAADRSSLRGQALLPILENVEALATVGGCGCRSTTHPCPSRPGQAHSGGQRCCLRCRVPLQLRLRPARHAAGCYGRHRRGHRGHSVEVRRPPRNPALHPRKLHPVHGVHLRLPRHRPAQLLAGPQHPALDSRLLLHRRPRRPHQAHARPSAYREGRPHPHGR